MFFLREEKGERGRERAHIVECFYNKSFFVVFCLE